VEKILQQILEQSASVEVGSWSHGYHQFNQLDQEFHETIIGAAGNPFLVTAYRSLNIHLELGRFYKVFRDMDQQQTCVEHNAIVQALRDRNPAAAAAAVEEHLHATEDRIFRLIDKYPESLTGYNGTKSGR
ncbi:MAG: FCD domain-containing protein, partial [Caldilinea sp.]|nr:FCD domain-containing protein [Caldilinea sp.]